jgi:hypothetical protein
MNRCKFNCETNMKIALNPNRHRKGVLLWLVTVILVIVVAAIIITKLIQFCEKNFPVPPVEPPESNSITGEIAYLEPYQHAVPYNPAYPMAFTPGAVTNYEDVVLNYGMTNCAGTNCPWLQIISAWPDPGVTLPATTLQSAVTAGLASEGYTYSNITTQYWTNGAPLFVDTSIDPTCTNCVVIWRADNLQFTNAVPVFTNTITDTGSFSWTDFTAPTNGGFYFAVRSP